MALFFNLYQEIRVKENEIHGLNEPNGTANWHSEMQESFQHGAI